MTPRQFIDEAVASATNACILWPFSVVRPTGYGQLRYNGRVVGAHRLACRLAHGEPPSGYETAHSCGVRACVNPRHLRWATRSENGLDRRRHGTSKPANTKLTQAQVDAIRERSAAGEGQTALAREYGVSQPLVYDIIHWRKWRS